MTSTLKTRPREHVPEQGRRKSNVHSRNLLLLWAGQFVNTAGLMMLVPIMPFYLKDMGLQGIAQTQTWSGVAIAAPALALTVATPLWGRVGDRVGRKWMVVRALLGLGLAMVVMAAAFTPLVLVAGRLLQGALGGVVEAAAAFAGSTGSDKKRGSSLGKSFSATAAGALVGPIAGGLFVGAGGLRQLMLVIAAAAVVLAVGCAVGLREPERSRAQGHEQPARERGGAMRVPGAVPLALAAIGAYFGVYGLIPVFAEHVSGIVTASNAASLWTGVLHSVMWGATLIGSFWWGKRNDATGRPVRAFALAAGGCAVSIAAVVLPLGPIALIPLRLAQGFCFAALAQSLFLHFSRHAPEERKSSFVSTANSFLLVGQSVGPLLAGPLVMAMPVSGAVVVMAVASGVACLLAMGPARAEKHATVNDEADGEQTAPLTAVAPAGTRRDSSETPAGGVEVRPFRAWVLAPERLRGQADRHATPWARANAGHAVHVLDEWKRRRVLVREPQPGLFAYEQQGPLGWQRGLISAVHLDSRLLPHEDVTPARTEEVAELIRTSGTVPPVLLGYSGDGRTARHLDAATQGQPLAEVFTTDGQEHRIWRLNGREAWDEITDELQSRSALIADGHHRHAAARQLRRQRYAAGHGAGPWDYVPGVLVDTKHSPLQLQPMHRVLPRVDPRRLFAAAARQFRITPLGGTLEGWVKVLRAHAARGPAFVLATGDHAVLLTHPHPRFLHRSLDRLPRPLQSLHVSLLHALITVEWQVPVSEIGYEPSATKALQRVREQAGAVVLTVPLAERDLRAAAAAGIRLPHKVTSFGPKPHPSLVLRILELDRAECRESIA